MKTSNKHLLKLAQAIAKKELKGHLKFYQEVIPHAYEKESTPEAKERFYNDSVKHFYTQLSRIKNALLNGKFYMSVTSVSKSGMSRTLKIGYIFKNNFVHIRNEHLLALAGLDKKGKISGCGMDMLFHSQYILFNKLHRSYKEAKYQTRMKTYNTI